MVNFFFLERKLKNEQSEILATATIEKRENGLGTSPRVVKLIPRRAGSISSLYGALTNLEAKKLCNLKKKVPHKTRPKYAAFQIFDGSLTVLSLCMVHTYVSAFIAFVVTLTIQYYYCIVAIYDCVVDTSLAYRQD